MPFCTIMAISPVVEILAMFDGVPAACGNAVAQAFATECVAGHAAMVMAMRLVDDGFDFGKRKRRIDPQFSCGAERIVCRRKDFDPVRAIMNLFADSAASVIGSRDGFVAARYGDSWEADGRHDGADSLGGDLEARAREVTAIDGVAHVDIAVAFAVGAQVTRAGKSGAQIGLRFLQGQERPGLVRGRYARCAAGSVS